MVGGGKITADDQQHTSIAREQMESALDGWRSAVSEFLAKGLSPREAAIAANGEHPGLREKMLAESNAAQSADSQRSAASAKALDVRDRQIAELKTQLASKDAEIARKDQQISGLVSMQSSGGMFAKISSNSGASVSGSHAKWNSEFNKHLQRGLSRGEAAIAANGEHPGLREKMLKEVNAR